MVMWVRRQTSVGELDTPAIEKLASWPDSDENGRVTVLSHAYGRAHESGCEPYCCAASIRYSAASAASAEKFALRGSVRTSLHWPFAYIT